MPVHWPWLPSICATSDDERGRNGVSSVLPSSTSCSATWQIVFIRSGSDSRSFQGAWSDRYLFASASVRIVSLIASLNLDWPSEEPTEAHASFECCKIEIGRA